MFFSRTYFNQSTDQIQHFVKTYYSAHPNSVELEIIRKNNLKKKNHDAETSLNNGMLYLIENFTNGEKELMRIPPDPFKIVNCIRGMDLLVSKAMLWQCTQKMYGVKNAQLFLPRTWVLRTRLNVSEMNLNNSDILIFKKEIQRQQGLKLIRFGDLKNMSEPELDKLCKEYSIAQKYLDNPFIINGRKTNMRVYIFVKICDGKFEVYMYNDGFMYYTKKPYEISTNLDSSITTGYIDRKVYAQNPLTHKDLRSYLGLKRSTVLFANIGKSFQNVLKTYAKVFKNSYHTSFQLFGADIQADSNLNVKILEFNKSPDVDPKDAKDGKLKRSLQYDMYALLGFKKPSGSESENGFIRLL